MSQCQRLPVTATKAERLEAHRAKVVRKARERAARFQSHLKERDTRGYQRRMRWLLRANLSSSHPDYGMTHAEHVRAKAKRGSR